MNDTHREASLQDLLDAAMTILTSEAPRHGDIVVAAAQRLRARLAKPGRASRPEAMQRLPAHRVLAPALALARETSPALAVLADRFSRIESSLAWKPSMRPGDPGMDLDDGYAGAIIVGPGGLETRDDVKIGVSLMTPGNAYPDHAHPPEEIYVVLSGGEWRQNAGPWHAPGRGGLVHNPPGITHAMRATQAPLLAIWFLLVDAAVDARAPTATVATDKRG
ncbi:MAG: transcriptional regulator [Alphaproteobacteria bacterium]|nr:transcriptional regulator [Alphaproteobacteria bacterium]